MTDRCETCGAPKHRGTCEEYAAAFGQLSRDLRGYLDEMKAALEAIKAAELERQTK